jgi:hypothetical protein
VKTANAEQEKQYTNATLKKNFQEQIKLFGSTRYANTTLTPKYKYKG